MAPANNLPPLRALLIFEAAARLGTFSAAAREFNITQPSVSRNIADLEGALKAPLFERNAKGLKLTREGEVLRRSVIDGFEHIKSAINEISLLSHKREIVEISTSTAFVNYWFMPQMRDFHRDFPDVDLRFQLISGALTGPSEFDIALRTTSPGSASPAAECIPEIVLPVCSPSYLAQHGSLDEPFPGSQHTLLHLAGINQDWDRLWGRPAKELPDHRIMEFSDYSVALQATLNGNGIALGWLSVILVALREGRLVPAAARRTTTGKTFEFVLTRGAQARPVVHEIRKWIVQRLKSDIETTLKLLGGPS